MVSERRVAAIEAALYGMDEIRELLGEPPAVPVAPVASWDDEVTTLSVARNAPRTVAEHVLRRTIQEAQLIPEHGERRASAPYRKTHDRLIKVEHRGCIVCGVTDQTLGSPEHNPFDAAQLETHHRMIEWSLTNAIDVTKFNERVLPGLRRRTPDRTDYQRPFTQAQLERWIDADADNMWVLCDVHHRHPLVGIHMVTGPVWGPQDLLLPHFQSGRKGT